ncbi:MAG: PhnD/SsuA/transferrin family substrate-binding protein [Campylobacterales bacterium]|nr:PhnD/SsuA/transferrin family substrate-binding protein [Campylobacterales bacterium]
MRHIILLFLCCSALVFANPHTLRFAPLPMLKSEIVLQQYVGIFSFLSQKLGVTFEIVYFTDYEKILEALAQNRVDIAHLGPLPYARLLHNAIPVQPLVQFLNEDGKSTYTCSLITAHHARNLPLKQHTIALTQPLSTCGFLSMSHLLKREGIALEEQPYFYADTHTNVILKLLLGEAHSGGVKSSVFSDYKHLGLIERSRSTALPGFLWVGSAKLPSALAKEIQEALFSLEPTGKDTDLMHSWADAFKHGAIAPNLGEYEEVLNLYLNTVFP